MAELHLTFLSDLVELRKTPFCGAQLEAGVFVEGLTRSVVSSTAAAGEV